MEKISLKREYIKITDDAGHIISCGGNQEWFKDVSTLDIKGQGCGIISSLDAVLYLQNSPALPLNKYKNYLDDFLGVNVFTKYYLKKLFFTKSAIGIIPKQICRYINRISQGKLHASWNGLHGHKSMLEKMEIMIKNDYPVIWSLYSKKNKITLYTFDEKSGDFIPATSTNNHYVNAIGIIHDPSTNHQTMIKISSWGRIYYVDYNEYLDYVGKSLISSYCSNIILISKKLQ